jgi:hypothetical protein
MARLPLECWLALGYAVFLSLMAFLFESVSRHALYARSTAEAQALSIIPVATYGNAPRTSISSRLCRKS